jgi:hypothetical protein
MAVFVKDRTQGVHQLRALVDEALSAAEHHGTRLLGRALWGRLKEWRAVATRYEKTARSFMGVLCLAASKDWLRR